MLQGTITALITPFDHNHLDEKGLITLIERQTAAGVNAICILGTTGESCTLSDAEQKKIIQLSVKACKGKIPLVVGTGCNSTHLTIEKTKQALDLGADYALVINPYCNRPTQEGLFRHFEQLASQVALPFIVYNHPTRTGINLEAATLEKITHLPNMVGVKECSGNFNQASDFIAILQKKGLKLFSGDDSLTLPLCSLGASGVVSVLSNLMPSKMKTFVDACMQGKSVEARKLHFELLALFNALNLESNPIAIKEAMRMHNLPSGGCRLPLCAMSEKNKKNLEGVIGEEI